MKSERSWRKEWMSLHSFHCLFVHDTIMPWQEYDSSLLFILYTATRIEFLKNPLNNNLWWLPTIHYTMMSKLLTQNINLLIIVILFCILYEFPSAILQFTKFCSECVPSKMYPIYYIFISMANFSISRISIWFFLICFHFSVNLLGFVSYILILFLGNGIHSFILF